MRSIIEGVMRDVMYNVPSEKDVSKCIIDEACIAEGKAPTLIYKTKKTAGNDNPDMGKLDVG